MKNSKTKLAPLFHLSKDLDLPNEVNPINILRTIENDGDPIADMIQVIRPIIKANGKLSALKKGYRLYNHADGLFHYFEDQKVKFPGIFIFSFSHFDIVMWRLELTMNCSSVCLNRRQIPVTHVLVFNAMSILLLKIVAFIAFYEGVILEELQRKYVGERRKFQSI